MPSTLRDRLTVAAHCRTDGSNNAVICPITCHLIEVYGMVGTSVGEGAVKMLGSQIETSYWDLIFLKISSKQEPQHQIHVSMIDKKNIWWLFVIAWLQRISRTLLCSHDKSFLPIIRHLIQNKDLVKSLWATGTDQTRTRLDRNRPDESALYWASLTIHYKGLDLHALDMVYISIN